MTAHILGYKWKEEDMVQKWQEMHCQSLQILYMEDGVKSVHDNEQPVFHYVTISSVEVKSNGGNCVWTRALCR